MKKSLITFAVVAASFSAIAHATTLPTIGSDCSNSGDVSATDASGTTMLLCANKKWADAASLDGVTVKLDATADHPTAGVAQALTMTSAGFVGVPSVRSATQDLSYASAQPASEVHLGSTSVGVYVSTMVVGFNPDHTAHIKVVIDVTKRVGQWTTQIDMNVPVDQKTTIARDFDGVEYTITVGKRAS